MARSPRVVTPHPAAVDDYLRTLDHLSEVIQDDLAAGDTTIADALRKLIERVTVIPAPAGTPPTISVHGRLETLLDLPPYSGSLSPGVLVAGDRIGRSPAIDVPELFELFFERVAG